MSTRLQLSLFVAVLCAMPVAQAGAAQASAH